MAGCIAGFALGILSAALKWARRTPVSGLPCPHPLCKNVLPKTGLWKIEPYKNGGAWVEESCPVCLGRVLFVPRLGRGPDETHADDKYIRVHVPELKS